MFSETSGSKISYKTTHKMEQTNLDIEKPPRLKETCPVEIQEHLPGLEKPQKKTKHGRSAKTEDKKISKVSVKSKLSLPKLNSKEIPQQRIDAGEPYGNQRVLPEVTFLQEKSAVDFQKPDETTTVLPLKHDEYFEKSLLQEFKDSSNPGPSECQLIFKVPDSELKINDLNIVEEDKLEESKALKRWEFWMKDKIRLQNHLCQRLRVESAALQIHESDKYRQIAEDKMLLSYAQLPEADKWRGHPYRWQSKIRLGQNKRNKLNLDNIGQYTAVKTDIQEGKAPKMQFVGIPKSIQHEKGILYGLENTALKKLKKMPYRQERISNLMTQIKKLKPYDIEMDELVVIGEKIPQPQQEENCENVSLGTLPEINIETENCEQHCFDYRQSIFCLAIEGEEVKYELDADFCQNSDKVFTWLVDFGVSKVGSLVEKALRIENRGTVTVSYNWVSHKFEQKQFLDSSQPKHHQPWFFFNKNSGFFLPGQIYNLKFYLKAETSGMRKEIWHLKTTPSLSKNPQGLWDATIILSAVAADDFLNQRESLESYLNKRVSDSVAAFVLKVILYKVFNSCKNLREIEYRSIFFEKELFEYHNSKYYYHSSVIRELHAVFKQISNKSQTEWDLSLNSLVALIQAYSKGKEKESLFLTVVESAKKLLRPNYLFVKKSKTYRKSYEILCRMTNSMEEDYDYIRKLLSQKKEKAFRKTWSGHRETGEFTSSSSLIAEEMGEGDSNSATVLLEIKPINFIVFRTMFYLKVYHRMCEAIEQIVGVLETNKLFEFRKQVNRKPKKPSRINRW